MIKNYASKSPLENIFRAIQKTLAEHKAKQVMFNYDDQGRCAEIAFIVATPNRDLQIRLPARVDRVEELFERQGVRKRFPDQAYRTAWATLRDWLDSQMALLDWDMVKMEEVFLPYVVIDPAGHTIFDILKNRNYLLPEAK